MANKRARGLLVNTNATAGQTGFQPSGLSPATVFGQGVDGFWGDSTDSATLFQTTAGATPAGPGDFCGLRLDKSQGLEQTFLASGESYENINFDTFAQTPTGFVAEKTTPGGNDFAVSGNLISVSENKWYLIEFNAVQVPNGGADALLSSNTNSRSNEVVFGSLGKQRVVLTPDFSGDFSITFRSAKLGVIEIENVKAYELKGNHQYQSTTASKPTVQIVDGVQALTLDDDDDSMLIDVPPGGWSGTFVQGTALGVIVGEIDVPAGPYQIPTDPRYAGPGSDIHTVIVNRTLAPNELDGLVEWVGQRCPVADFAGATKLGGWFRERADLTRLILTGPDSGTLPVSAIFFAFGTDNLRTVALSGFDIEDANGMFFNSGIEALDWQGCSFSECSRFNDTLRGSSLTSLDMRTVATTSANIFTRFALGCPLETLLVYGGPQNPFSDSPCVDYRRAFQDTNLSQQSYADIVTAIEAAGTSNGELDITGGTSTTTGAAQTAVDALRGRGWTVTTPDGY